jgi:hypothetical protein
MIIVGLLAAHVTIMMTALSICLQRPGESAVIPNYYEKEISYDTFKAQMTASQKLGWTVTSQPTGDLDPMGTPKFELNLTDSQNKPVAADLSVHCFHWSHGNEARTIPAKLTAPGTYVFALPFKYKGFWQFDVTATSNGKTFVQSLNQFVE